MNFKVDENMIVEADRIRIGESTKKNDMTI
jgi:hypothetical protein